MPNRVQVGQLKVARVLCEFAVEEAIPGSGVDPAAFWSRAEALIHDFALRNQELLARRVELQTAIDKYHRRLPGP
nr:hypothetical protein [Parafrankia soli]